MDNKKLIFSLCLIIILIVGLLIFLNSKSNVFVNSFEDCVMVGNPVMESYPAKCEHNGVVYTEEIEIPTEDLVSYFSNQMFETAVEKSEGRIPIEGFTPEMYLGLFGGLEEYDFDNVGAINGYYIYSSGNLSFIMDSEELITSADGSLNLEGMSDLLKNLEKRLGIQIETKENIDYLISLIE